MEESHAKNSINDSTKRVNRKMRAISVDLYIALSPAPHYFSAQASKPDPKSYKETLSHRPVAWNFS